MLCSPNSHMSSFAKPWLVWGKGGGVRKVFRVRRKKMQYLLLLKKQREYPTKSKLFAEMRRNWLTLPWFQRTSLVFGDNGDSSLFSSSDTRSALCRAEEGAPRRLFSFSHRISFLCFLSVKGAFPNLRLARFLLSA